MDEMRIESKFMKAIISKFVAKLVKDSTGIVCDVNLQNFKLSFDENGKAAVSTSIEMEADAVYVKKFLSKKVMGL